jgi:lipopolysaccharide export system protein LptC
MFQRSWTVAWLGALVLASIACRSRETTEAAAVAPELKLEGVHFRVWRGDALRAQGVARQVTIRRDTSQATALGLQAELPAAGQPVEITAPEASGLLSAQTYSARGGVVVVHGAERATTETARYQPGPGGQGLVLGDDPVELERGALRLSGVGFTLDPRTGELQLGGPVTTHAPSDGQGAPR